MLNRVYEHTAEQMSELPDNSVALMVTSPPYHVGKAADRPSPYRRQLGPEFSNSCKHFVGEHHATVAALEGSVDRVQAMHLTYKMSRATAPAFIG